MKTKILIAIVATAAITLSFTFATKSKVAKHSDDKSKIVTSTNKLESPLGGFSSVDEL